MRPTHLFAATLIPARLLAGPCRAAQFPLSTFEEPFRDAMVYGAGGSPQSLAVDDANGDGQPDLVAADTLANTLVVLMNNYIPGSSGSACTAVQPLVNRYEINRVAASASERNAKEGK